MTYDELIDSILTAQREMIKHCIEANSVTLNGKKYGKIISPMGCRAFLSPWYERGGIEPADDKDEPVLLAYEGKGAVEFADDGLHQLVFSLREQALGVFAEGDALLHGHLQLFLAFEHDFLRKAFLAFEEVGKHLAEFFLVVFGLVVILRLQGAERLLRCGVFGHGLKGLTVAEIAELVLLCAGGRGPAKRQQEQGCCRHQKMCSSLHSFVTFCIHRCKNKAIFSHGQAFFGKECLPL